jgi:hypothetical protein
MQKSLIVRDIMDYPAQGVEQLNAYLSQGWKVISSCGMPSAVSISSTSAYSSKYIAPTCLVILEKKG